MDSSTPRKLAENVVLLLVSRVSMALSLPAIALIATLGQGWLDNHVKELIEAKVSMEMAPIRVRLDQAELSREKLSIVVAQFVTDFAVLKLSTDKDRASLEKFSDEWAAKFERLYDKVSEVGRQVAGLTALSNGRISSGSLGRGNEIAASP